MESQNGDRLSQLVVRSQVILNLFFIQEDYKVTFDIFFHKSIKSSFYMNCRFHYIIFYVIKNFPLKKKRHKTAVEEPHEKTINSNLEFATYSL